MSKKIRRSVTNVSSRQEQSTFLECAMAIAAREPDYTAIVYTTVENGQIIINIACEADKRWIENVVSTVAAYAAQSVGSDRTIELVSAAVLGK
jgi:hypothetical protein